MINLSQEILKFSNEIRRSPDDAERVELACDLLDTLASMLTGWSAHQAFGAPGNWGYDTPIGEALLKDLQTSSINGVELIKEERARQIFKEGYNAAHDDAHGETVLLEAAHCYLLCGYQKTSNSEHNHNDAPSLWPFEASSWKPSKDRLPNLIKAGALIAAEIDRLNRNAVA